LAKMANTSFLIIAICLNVGLALASLLPPNVRFHQMFKNKPIHNFKQELNINETTELIMERLPRVVKVDSYDLTITPYFPFPGLPKEEKQDFTFDGVVKIKFTITNQTKEFPFYSKVTSINSQKLVGEDGKEVEIKSIEVDPTSTVGKVKVAQDFQLNKPYELTLNFTGDIQNGNAGEVGLFFNQYQSTLETNEQHYLIGTQFEALSAREMYPSVDDPHFKATINLTIIYPKGAKIFSNSLPKKDEEHSKYRQLVTFKPTPIMSTYLLAFVIGDYKVANTTSKSGIPIRTISIVNEDKSLEESAKISAQCLDAIEGMLGVSYGQSKLDNADTLTLGEAGAMENWELIIYRGIVGFKPITEVGHFTRSSVICHETSHQWFGDLVTADNWGQVFLHESFANYFENHALLYGKIYDPQTVEAEILSSRQTGMDATLRNDHPLVIKIQAFDMVTYAAGGAILRMIDGAVENKIFLSALNKYLNARKYKTATYEDLILAFEQALDNQPLCGDLKIREFLEDFFLQAYYPNVKVAIQNKEFVFKQTSAKEGNKNKWNVPLFVSDLAENKKIDVLWLLKNNSLCSKTLKLPLDSKKQYNFNTNERSFAQVEVASEIWEQRLKELDFSKMSHLTVSGLLHEAVEQDKCEKTDFGQKLARKLIKDRNGDVPLYVAAEFLSQNHSLNEDKELKSKLYSRLQWDPTTSNDKLFNQLFLINAVHDKFGDLEQKALEYFAEFEKSCSTSNDLIKCNKILAENKKAIYCAGLLSNNAKSTKFFKKYALKIMKLSKKNSLVNLDFEMETIKSAIKECHPYGNLL